MPLNVERKNGKWQNFAKLIHTEYSSSYFFENQDIKNVFAAAIF